MSPSPNTCSTSLVLRVATTQDAPFVRALAENAFMVYGSYNDYLGQWFRDDVVRTQIAEIDGRAVGFSMLAVYANEDRPGTSIADLIAIAVKEEYRSKGIGKALLNETIAHAQTIRPPAPEMWLAVADGNARAQRLFAKSGFRLGPGIGVYPAGQHAVRMIKQLA